MSGPRVTSGVDSKQDYATPDEFIAAVEKRFGNITFDLAAHAGNAKHARYFAPPDHEGKDDAAYGFDAFKHNWSKLGGGLLWLNCEFSDCGKWADKCSLDAMLGADIVLLTPASVGSNWFHDFCAGRADTYLLNGRLKFDGKNFFPKDCMLNHFGPRANGAMNIWDWKRDLIIRSWSLRSVPHLAAVNDFRRPGA